MLFGKLRPYLAKAWLADRGGAAVGDFLVLRMSGEMLPRFFQYNLLRPEIIGRLVVASYGSKMPRTSWEELREIELPIPDLNSQQAILRFLERETGEIDAFIRDQEELIGLLKERRAATINHAVTKGLNPDAPMRLTNFLWVEEIPAHWEIVPFTKLAPQRVDYRGATPTKVEAGVLLVTARNVKSGYIDYSVSNEFIRPEDYESVMRRGLPALGDVLLTMEAPLGNVALVDRVDVAFAQRIIKFRLARPNLPEFAKFAMNATYFQRQLQSRATGSTALGIKASKLSEFALAVPPPEEQHQISDYLTAMTAELDLAMADALAAIELSRERRSALISAAVMGKIDVRERAGV